MEALGRLARRLGHDLNNTFGVIQNTVEMTLDRLPQDSALREDLSLADEALQSAKSTTGWLAVFHHREARDRAPLDLCLATADALRVLRVALPEAIELVADARCRPEPWVHASPTQLRRLLFALALEARERLSAGGILHVTVTRDARAARLVAGFTPAGRASAGLSEIRAAVAELGAQVTSDTDATLEITLPLIPAPQPGGTPRGRGETILVADANSYLRRMIATELTSRGYRVLHATDREQLVEQLEQHGGAVGLLIVDQELPGGVESLQSAAPMVLVTPSDERSADLRLDGGTRRLSKPFQLTELTALAGSLLSPREAPR